MNSWMDLAMRVQSIAQAGLAYGKNEYDLERYEELRDIAAQMVAINTDIPVEIVKMHFVMRMAIRHRRWTPGLLFFKMEKFCLCMRKWNMGIAGRLV